jgi:anaerobic selenocysteine-containing dehydrogenase
MGKEIKVGLCRGCVHDQCQVEALVEDGKLIKTMNFQGSPFTSVWGPEACPKQRAFIDLLNDSRRLNYPLKRKGTRGEGKWEQIEWDQALDEIAQRVSQAKKDHGAESVGALFAGYNDQWDIARFFNLFGSASTENLDFRVCGGTEAFMDIICTGSAHCLNAPTDKVQCFVMWSGEHWTTSGIKWQTESKAAKLIVVNSTGSPLARKAAVWLQPRPGTDTALGLGWLNVIINESLYDNEFVEKWVFGFDRLAARVREFPPERVEEITWVPRQKIIDAATLYATTKPACIGWGSACGHIGRNSAEAERVRIALRAITGNLEVDGGNHSLRPHSKLVSFKEMGLEEMLPPAQYRKALGSDTFRVMSWRGWEMLADKNKKSLRAHVIRGSSYPALIHAIRRGEPFQVRVLFTAGCNPLVTAPNTRNCYDALKHHLDLHVSLELFMTPTAMLADYVLPITSWAERPAMNWLEYTNSVIVGQRLMPKFVPGKYDRRDDFDVWRGLGIKLGQEEYWPWKDLDEANDYRLKNFDMTLDEFARNKGWDTEPIQFKGYEKEGFRTPTGKVELWSTIFEALGYDPLPHYEEPAESPISRPDLAREYPYVLINNPKSRFFLHSQFRQSTYLRKRHPEPFVRIHPDTAKKHGIKAGDMVWIESRRGKIRQKARVTRDVHPGIIAPDFGWWFPEKAGEEPSLFGVFESNMNVLTSDAMDYADRVTGAWNLESLLCKIHKVKD